MQRREMLTTMVLGTGALAMARSPVFAAETREFGGPRFAAAIAAAEARTGGRLGVAITDLAIGRSFAHRGDERFPMCSTFKFLLSAAVLHSTERGRLSLTRAVTVRARDIVGNSPATKARVGRTMTVAELCRGTMTQSDNAAANLLLPLIGGVDGFNAFARLLGDTATRLDRHEPMLNTAVHGDMRDTTTPRAMLGSMNAALFGPTLTPASRARLTGWLVANTTGGGRLRAGLPRTWRAGDRTGTGENGSANDIGVLWPRPQRRPVLVASYLTGAKVSQARQYAAHAEVARAIAAEVA